MAIMMDSPKLRALPRTQLQSLAKREVVRAVGKTEDIIRRLLRKHPRGVPALEDTANPSASLAPPNLSVPKTRRKGTPSPPPAPATSKDWTHHKGKGKQTASPSPSSSTEALELLYFEDEPVAGPSNTNPETASAHPSEALPGHPAAEPIPIAVELSPAPSPGCPPRAREAHSEDENTRGPAAPPEAPNPIHQADAAEGDDLDDVYDYPKGAPTHYMVVDTLRQFTTLANAIPTMKTHIAESRCLLRRTDTLLEKATPDVRELTVTREYLETFLLAKMKKKRELWDGTGKMDKGARKVRMAWLRAERKAENEKRWKEANELNKKHGLEPEPFSAFVSESDEEVIESLQTTPTSSGSGSCKRSRDESDDGASDGGVDADDENQKKRARL